MGKPQSKEGHATHILYQKWDSDPGNIHFSSGSNDLQWHPKMKTLLRLTVSLAVMSYCLSVQKRDAGGPPESVTKIFQDVQKCVGVYVHEIKGHPRSGSDDPNYVPPPETVADIREGLKLCADQFTVSAWTWCK